MSHRNEPAVITAKFENVSKELNKGIKVTGEAIKNVGNVAKEEAQKAISNGKGHVEKAAHKLSEGASETYDVLREEGEAYLHQAASALQDMQDRTEHYIQTHPFKSVFIAFGLGALCVLAASFKCSITRRR